MEITMGKTEPEADRRVKIKSDAHAHLGCLVGGFWTTFVLLIIMAVAGYFLVNTDGVRDIISSTVADELGVDKNNVEFVSLAITLPYNVQINSLNVTLDDATNSFITADEVTLLGVLGFWNGIKVDGGSMRIPVKPDFIDLPLMCNGLVSLPDETIENLSLYLFKNFRNVKLDLIDCKMIWDEYDVIVNGVDLFFDEDVIPGELDVNFCSLKISDYISKKNVIVSNAEFLWMVYADDPYVEIINSSKDVKKECFLRNK
jgi:hypothetical protein